MQKRGFLYELKKNKVLFLMIMPVVIYFIVFCYFPMAGSYIAFTRFDLVKGIFKSPFVGFENFKYLVGSGTLTKITFNTVAYNIVFIILGSFTQIAAAIFLSEVPGRIFKKASQSIMFLPYFVSYVLIGVFVYQIFNYEYGSMNNILKSMGFEPYDAFSNVGLWKYVIIFFYLWKGLGYGMVIYLAAIMNINSEYYEAAEIDGADIFQQIRYITLPLIKSTFVILLLFSIGSILKGQLDLFYQITGNNGTLFDSTQVIDTYVFRSLISYVDYGLVSAAGLYQSFFGFVLVLVSNYFVKRIDEEYALF